MPRAGVDAGRRSVTSSTFAGPTGRLVHRRSAFRLTTGIFVCMGGQGLSRPSKAELAKMYRRLGSVPAVADDLGVAFETARRWLVDAGVILNRKGRPSSNAASLDPSILARRYEGGASIAQLGEAFGVSPATVRSRLIEAGVELRQRPGWKY